MPDPKRIREDLTRELGSARIVTDEETLARRSRDTWVIAIWRDMQKTLPRAACVVRPESTAEVAKVVRYAAKERVPLVPFGAGSGVCGAVQAEPGSIVLDLGAMRRLIAIDDTSLLATVEPGLLGSEFEAALNEAGYSMGHFPQSIGVSSVGGWVATRAAGQFSTRYGNIEDMLVAFEAVLPSGEVVRTRPIPRGATGQDIRHLFLGAEGTAGVLTELTFAIHPLPETTRTQAIAFPSMKAGLEALRLVVRAGWRPPVLRLYDDIEAARTYADSVQSGESLLLALSEGPDAMTSAEIAAVETISAGAGGRMVGSKPVDHWLGHRNTVPTFESFLQQNVIVDTIEVAVTWDRIVALYEGVLKGMRAVPGLIVASGHSSHSYVTGTNIYFTFAARPERPEDTETLYFAVWRAAMEATLEAGGTISHHHGIGRVRRDWLARDLGSAYPLLRTLKQALDPLGIMNPGALLPESTVG
jgi:alkyldihydroxyacetonephosphate synthase